MLRCEQCKMANENTRYKDKYKLINLECIILWSHQDIPKLDVVVWMRNVVLMNADSRYSMIKMISVRLKKKILPTLYKYINFFYFSSIVNLMLRTPTSTFLPKMSHALNRWDSMYIMLFAIQYNVIKLEKEFQWYFLLLVVL